jgi:NAD(P)-dependent dehydrogenase (short-subunit alcohol dehydrogenase family)
LADELSGVGLVTGGGRGIGAGIARELSDAGMKVAVSSRTREQVEEVAREIDGLGVVADVSSPGDAEAMMAEVERELGSIDLLVNNAGVAGWGNKAWEEDPADWWRVFEINVLGA